MPPAELVDRPLVSVIVPTLNEAANLPLLVPRVAAALAGVAYEILIMDDGSADDTPAVCQRLTVDYPLRLVIRDSPRNGLSGAVLQGMTMARGEILVVMDADLQHPPERLVALLEALKEGADFALGSRYVEGGSTQEHWGVFRRINSRVATLLARPFAGKVRDPMSGFFALRRSTFEAAERLTPLGYKIGLELMCKCRVQRVREVPIHFDLRVRGQSKLTLTQQFKYLEHLSRLYDYRFPRLSPMGKFFIALAIAWLAGAGAFFVLHRAMGIPQAVAVSYGVAIAMTAVLHLRYVRTQWEFLRTRHPWRDFWIASAVEWVVCILVVSWAQWRLASPRPIELFILGYGAALVGRYVCRKEFLLDLRGLHGEPRADEMTARS
jgi:dolichol-phosphate mannosyltransferase